MHRISVVVAGVGLILFSSCTSRPGPAAAPAEAENPGAAATPAEQDTGGGPLGVARQVAPGAEPLPVAEYRVFREQRVEVKPTHLFRTPDNGFLVRFEDGSWANGRQSWRDRGAITTWDPQSEGDLLASMKYPDPPAPPQEFYLRTFAELPHSITRIAHDSNERFLFALSREGNLWRIDFKAGQKTQLLTGRDYVEQEDIGALGLALDDRDRAYIVTNYQDDSVLPNLNRVTIFRTTGPATAETVQVQRWLETSYPYGIGSYNHGVAHAAFGPDGMLYVGSGSRTDANEKSGSDRYSSIGEVELTSCIWRIDPNSESPQIEIYADGLRNPFGFCWDSQGRMIATESGPNAMPPEEINIIERGKHYGFPWRFSNWSVNPYAHVGEAPPGLEMVDPVINIGPAGIGSNGKPMATLEAHTSPVGICYLDSSWGETYGDAFLVARFGSGVNYVETIPSDMLLMRFKKQSDGSEVMEAHSFMTGLARPIDVRAVGGKIYVVEFARLSVDENSRRWGQLYREWLPGRILELTPMQSANPAAGQSGI